MKTTLDLPDDLMRRVKIRAVQEHKKMKDAVAEWLERGMATRQATKEKLPKPLRASLAASYPPPKI